MELIDVINSLNWGGNGYSGYSAEGKSSPGAAETAAMNNTTADRAGRESQFGSMGMDLGDVEGGDATATPMYQRLMKQGTEDTSRAYDNVRSKRAATANRSGFGYNQPAVQADQTSIDALEAKDIGSLSDDAYSAVQDKRMQAAAIRGQAAGTYNTSAANNQDQWGKLETQRKEARAKMWSKLAGGAITAAGVMTGQPELMMAGGGMMKG